MVFAPLEQAIFNCLYTSNTQNFVIVIEDGFYNPTQMVTELQNKFNTAAKNFLKGTKESKSGFSNQKNC